MITIGFTLQIMHQTFHATMSFALLLLCFGGCDRSPPAPVGKPAPISASEAQELLKAIVDAELEAKDTVAAKPKIPLATPSGWSKTETRPLPAADHGFTVAYEHESGLAVTLYQFTRGHLFIPDGVKSAIVIDEMQRAKNGIEQAVQLGYWKAAKEIEAKTVQLGDSERQALWSRYQLTVDGADVASEIFVWAHANNLFKLRCTSRTDDEAVGGDALRSLLTALGSPIAGGDEEPKTK